MLLSNNNAQKKINIQPISAEWLTAHGVQLDVLRLDKWHEVVSGNKWFKLQYYLKEALSKGFTQVATFGGAWSNHIVATAFAGKQAGLHCTGIIRGEEPAVLSHTLTQAKAYGMHLKFVSRGEYKNKQEITNTMPEAYWINEGGYGSSGAAGAAGIALQVADFNNYTHIVCAVGTGTTLAGLIEASLPQQQLIGISVMKGNDTLTQAVNNILPKESKHKTFVITDGYHFGGYAKHTPALLHYMNQLWQQHALPTDFVYTAKTFYAVEDMIKNNRIPALSKVLMIHTGGLQGNFSLAGSLQF